MEAVAETDEELMERYLEGDEISEEELKAAIRKATCAAEFYPVYVDRASKTKGYN